MRATIRCATVALAVWAGGGAMAQDSPVVVELYTSQGCSSCPPADKLLAELAERDEVLPLSLHVDYWDYIGWTDKLASPKYTLRQKAYARAAGERMIYTPQMVIDGTSRVVGSRGMEVARAIEAHRDTQATVDVTATRSGGRVTVEAEMPEGAGTGARLVVQLVPFTPSERVSIKGGENEGHTLTYVNVVRDWHIMGEWDGTGTWSGEAELDGPAALIVQEAGFGAIVGAARID